MSSLTCLISSLSHNPIICEFIQLHRENNKTTSPWFTSEAWTSSPSEHIYIKTLDMHKKERRPRISTLHHLHGTWLCFAFM